jgi:hypothetical protein
MKAFSRILRWSFTIVAVCFGSCATVPPIDDTIHVPEPFSDVVARVSVGMESEIKHPITLTRDAVKYRREDIGSDTVRFEVWTWASDYGDQAPFAQVDVHRVSSGSTDIRIHEKSAGSGIPTYLAAKIRSWFPSTH